MADAIPRLSFTLGLAALLLLAAHLLATRLTQPAGVPGIAEAVALLLVVAECTVVFIVARRLRGDLPQAHAIAVTLALTGAAVGAGVAVVSGGFSGPYPFGVLPVLFAWPLLMPGGIRPAAAPILGGLFIHLGILALNANPPLIAAGATATLLVMCGALSLCTAEVLDASRRRTAQFSGHDWVTGALSEESLRLRLAELCARRARSRAPFCLVMVDIDRFKDINDALGQSAGDEVLLGLAAAARAEIRGHDLLSRLHADEFLLVLDECEAEDARGLVERLRIRLNREMSVRGKQVRVTFSAGIAPARPTDRLNPEELIQAAIHALEATKEMARSCTSVAPPPPPVGALDERAATAQQALAEESLTEETQVVLLPSVEVPLLEESGVEAVAPSEVVEEIEEVPENPDTAPAPVVAGVALADGEPAPTVAGDGARVALSDAELAATAVMPQVMKALLAPEPAAAEETAPPVLSVPQPASRPSAARRAPTAVPPELPSARSGVFEMIPPTPPAPEAWSNPAFAATPGPAPIEATPSQVTPPPLPREAPAATDATAEERRRRRTLTSP